MGSVQAEEVWDLLILVDATSLMDDYLASLRQSLPQILAISGLTNCFERIEPMAYRDYCDRALLEWSGWRGHKIPGKAQPDLVSIASKLEAVGCGDWPEAMKTGLAKCHQVMREVFGLLWRVFCSDREHPERQELPDLFGLKIDSIQDADEEQRMKAWLEESYDYTAEVTGLIQSVEESQRFPCVCLDPPWLSKIPMTARIASLPSLSLLSEMMSCSRLVVAATTGSFAALGASLPACLLPSLLLICLLTSAPLRTKKLQRVLRPSGRPSTSMSELLEQMGLFVPCLSVSAPPSHLHEMTRSLLPPQQLAPCKRAPPLQRI